jgi:hypothetical protein
MGILKEPKINICPLCDGEYIIGEYKKVNKEYKKVCSTCASRIKNKIIEGVN